jgi:hypothetical protein
MRRSAAGIAIVFCLHAPAMAAMDTIKNPAEKIRNPADRMYNPANDVKNPAGNIYNPAAKMDNPNPLSAPTQSVPPPAVSAKPVVQSPARPVIPQKSYYFKTVSEYISAAKKAFARDDYIEFLSVTEDALRRIEAGTIKASRKSRQKLAKFKAFGYGLLEN